VQIQIKELRKILSRAGQIHVVAWLLSTHNSELIATRQIYVYCMVRVSAAIRIPDLNPIVSGWCSRSFDGNEKKLVSEFLTFLALPINQHFQVILKIFVSRTLIWFYTTDTHHNLY
jgi:hypothetical protein